MSANPPIASPDNIVAGTGLTKTGLVLSTTFDPTIVTEVSNKKTACYILIDDGLTIGNTQPEPLPDATFLYHPFGGSISGNGVEGTVSASFSSSSAEQSTGAGQGGLGSTPSATQPYNVSDFPGMNQVTTQLRKADGDDILLSDLLSSAMGDDINAKVYGYISYRSDLGANAKWRLWFYYRRASDGYETSFTPDTILTNVKIYTPVVVSLLDMPVGAGLGGPIIDGEAAALLGPKSVGTAELDDLAVTAAKLAAAVSSRLPPAPSGAGKIIYDNGSSYSSLATGTDGYFLSLSSGVPAWVPSPTITTPVPKADGGFGVNVSTGLTNDYVAIVAGNAITIGALTAAAVPNISASKITSGTLAVAQGGTNLSSYTTGDLLYASGTTTIAKLADVATGQVLTSGGAGVAPAYSATPTVTTLTGNTSVLTPLLDTPSSGTLAIGTTNATDIGLNQSVTLAAGKSLSMAAGVGGLSLNGATGDWTMPTGTGSYLGASAKTLSLQTTAAAITIKSNTSGTVTIDSAGTLLLGASSATTTSLGRSGTITTLNGTIQCGVGSSFTSVSGGYAIDFDFSTSTGATWLPSGNISWTGASKKTISLVSTGSGSSITITAGAGSTWSTSAGALTLSGFVSMALQVAGSNIVTLASTGITLAAAKSITFTAGSGNLSLGSGTGDSTMTTGAFSWTGATNKALAFTAQGSSGTMEIRTGSGTLNIQSSSNDVTVQTITNAALLWLVSGTGRYILNGQDGGSLRYNTTDRWVLRIGSHTFTTGATSGSTTVGYSFTGAAHTTLTASTERNLFLVDLGQTVQFATGALTTQRSVLFKAPTFSFAGSSTITNAATVAIDAAPAQGTNATITNAYALWVQAGITKLDGALALTKATATGAALAATCNAQVGAVTTESLSTGSGSIDTYTITNSYVTTSSVILCQPSKGTNTVPVILTGVVPGSGSFTVQIYNPYGSAVSGTVIINFLVL